MFDFFGKSEVKVLRRLFLKGNPLMDYYLKIRNILSSKKIVVSPLQSVKSLKHTVIFKEWFKGGVFNYDFKRVHPSLDNSTISVPGIGYYKLEHVMVNGSSHLFHYQNSWYYQEIPSSDCARWAAAGEHLIESTNTHILSVELKKEIIENGIFIGGHFSKNWYHWVLEIISRIVILKEANLDLKGFYLCLPAVNENLKNHMDFLSFLDLDLKIKYLDADKYYVIKNAYLADAVFFGRPHWKRNKECYNQLPYFANHDGLRVYQQLLFGKLDIKHTETGRKIFLGRKNNLRIYNQDEVFAFFENQGFEMVYCEDLSVRQQIELFSQVDMIAGPTGAAWTNLLFCKPGCKAFCWAPDFQESYPIFGIFGLALGVDIRYDFFSVDGNDWRAWKSNGTYRLTEDFVQKNLRLLMES